MERAAPGPLTAAELQELVREVDPQAVLVSPRALRRAAQNAAPGRDYRPGPAALVPREALTKAVLPGELAEADLPEEVLLLPLPGPGGALREGREKTLRQAWRALFHGAVLRAVARLRREGKLAPDVVRARAAAIGEDAYAEAREVLAQDHRLPDDDAASAYAEFAATFLGLQAFDEERLRYTFPACDQARAGAALALDLDARGLLEKSRPAGAQLALPAPQPDPPNTLNDALVGPAESGPLQRQAAEEAARGNDVRAALLFQRAVENAPDKQKGRLRAEARLHIQRLVERIRKAFRLPEEELPAWQECLCALLAPASLGYWNGEAQLLYDVQRACHDLERELYAVDLVEWVTSFFTRPIKRPLPDLGLVLAVKYLRKAISGLPAARLEDGTLDRLDGLLRVAEGRLKSRLREALRPKINAALDEGGLVPVGKAERLSRDQLVGELLDSVEEHGYLSMGELRDAVARNRVNLPDLSPGDLIWGDSLLRANAALSRRLEGIYRKGESYLRLMQVFSSLFFGTVLGRVLTLYLLLPALAGLCSVVFVDAMVGEAAHLPELAHNFLEGNQGPEKKPEFKLNLFDASSAEGQVAFGLVVGAASLFFLLLIHGPPFRGFVWRLLVWAWRGLRGLLWDLPEYLLRLPAVRALLDSPVAQFVWHFALLPLLCTAPLLLALWLAGALGVGGWAASGAWFLVALVAANTTIGRRIQEVVADTAWLLWLQLRDDFLVGLWSAIVQFFRWAMGRITAALYTVDEWLRFREGEGPLSLVAKCVLGLLWFLVSYVFRFVLLLFVEPQVNPVKHFPVVTVGHKLSLLLVPAVASLPGMNTGLALVILGLVPGVYGFIAWELKENWRLYQANQSPELEPEVVGGHGEWVINYLRPGFHSGTLPSLFWRLRRATGGGYLRARDGLHHAEDEVRRFLRRAFVAPLKASRAWSPLAGVTVGEIHLTTRTIRAELCCPPEGPSAWVEFALERGELSAGVVEAGWMGRVRGEAREAVVAMLVALFKRAGAHDVSRPEARTIAARAVPWSLWAEWWERDEAGGPRPALLPEINLLPVGGT